MIIFNQTSRIIITCSNRLSGYVAQEVTALGLKPLRIFKTGVELEGTMTDCIKLNLNLRCASQVLFSLSTFNAATADDLYNAIFAMNWPDLLPANGYFSVTSNVDNETINNNLFANVRLKDAIVDNMRNANGDRPQTGPELNQAVVHLYWKGNEAEIFVDTSGETLSKHGYRKIPGQAPMLESLAAATLLAGKWNGASPFINPMCGSGTLAIEAALLATNRKPGLLRHNYAFMHWLGYDELVYEKLFSHLENMVTELAPSAEIIASDISEDAINISKINAGIAGVEQYLKFEVCDFMQATLPQNPGVVYMNPEYGDRLGEEVALQATYKRMGDFLKQQCKGYFGYIFTGNLELAKKIGLKPLRRIEFYNSKIDCRLLEYELYSGTRSPKNMEP